MNPFRVDESKFNGYISPLEPHLNIDHIKYYAPVDSTTKQFDVYNNMFVRNIIVPKGHAVLFSGESGCGKTSLMNRCLKLIKEHNWKINNYEQIHFIVDMANEKLSNKSAEEKVNTIIQCIHDSLDEEKITDNLYKEFGDQLGKDTSTILRFLERKLKEYNRILVILFPKVCTEAEIKQYMDYFYRSNWVLFFETHDPQIINYCNRSFGGLSTNPITCLEVHPLRENDGEIFVNNRLSLISDDLNKAKFDIKGLERFLSCALKRGGISVRGFEIICEKAYKTALDNNKELICFDDIAQVFISNKEF